MGRATPATLLALALLVSQPASASSSSSSDPLDAQQQQQESSNECPRNKLLAEVTGSCTPAGPARWNVTASDDGAIAFAFGDGMALLLDNEGDDVFVQPDLDQSWQPAASSGRHIAWVLPREPTSAQPSYMIRAETSTALQLRQSPGAGGGVRVTVAASSCELRAFEARPRADVFGDRYEFNFTGGDTLAETQAAFYWGTTLRLVVERTVAKNYTYPDGFVLSMLHHVPKRGYDGTYPDVDHEFHIKGRSILGNKLDNDITRRMVELQLRSCRNDPADLGRIPCAVHPDGVVEPGSPSLSEVRNALLTHSFLLHFFPIKPPPFVKTGSGQR
jgi:hypothetical protein